MHIGLFGGSFNPPHIAHLIVAETVCDACGLDRVLWVPNRKPPHKAEDEMTPPRQRLEMVRLAVDGNTRFEVCELELEREGVSYTIETVQALRRMHPDDVFSLIVGGDSLDNFGSWHRPDEIVRLADLIVYRRPGGSDRAPSAVADRVTFVDAPLLQVSSTDIRSRLRRGRSVRYLVPEAVRAYIASEGLYR